MNWGLILPPLMLAGSNLFMNVAWYGHLKAPKEAIWVAVLASWGLAFFEYWLAVPANRLGSKAYSLATQDDAGSVFTGRFRAGGMGAVRAKAGAGAIGGLCADYRGRSADFQRELTVGNSCG